MFLKQAKITCRATTHLLLILLISFLAATSSGCNALQPPSPATQPGLSSETAIKNPIPPAAPSASPTDKSAAPIQPVFTGTPTLGIIPTLTKPAAIQLLTYTPSPIPALACPSNMSEQMIFLDQNPAIQVRQGPGCEYPTITGDLKKPDPIRFFNISGKSRDWLLVNFCGDQQGWVFAPAVAKINLNADLATLPEANQPPLPKIPQAPLPNLEADDLVAQAGAVLTEFYLHLYNKNYAAAAALFAGGYGVAINWNPDVDPKDHPTLLMRACEWNGFHCFLRVHQILQAELISQMEVHFQVEFILPDGSLYQRAKENGTISQFTLRVVRGCSGKFFVVDWPFYEQYGG